MRRRKKQCFCNAFDLALDNPDLTYVEGYAKTGRQPEVLHAWVVDKSNRVVDNTWDNPESNEYFGIPLDRLYVEDIITRIGSFGVLCQGQDEEVLDFLRKGLPKKALANTGN